MFAAGAGTVAAGSAGCSSAGWGGRAMVRGIAGRGVGSMGLWRWGIGVEAVVGRMVWGRRRVVVRLRVGGSAMGRGLCMVVEVAGGRWMNLGSILALPFC